MPTDEEKLLEAIVRNIVSNPDAIVIERSIDERGVLLSLKVDPSDMGHVIGKGGRIANAIRQILHAVGGRTESRISFKLIEPEQQP